MVGMWWACDGHVTGMWWAVSCTIHDAMQAVLDKAGSPVDADELDRVLMSLEVTAGAAGGGMRHGS